MKVKPLFAAVALALCLTGCQSYQPTVTQQEMLARLDSIAKSLEKLDAELKTTRNDGWTPVNGTDDKKAVARIKEKLAAIPPLPEQPDDVCILKYINAVKNAANEDDLYTARRPQVEFYRKIGPGHLKLLLPELTGEERNYELIEALPELTGPADKALALSMMPEIPDLLIPVFRNGWSKENPRVVFATLGKHCPYKMRDHKRDLIALADNDEGRRLMIETFVQQPDLGFLYESLSRLPGVDPIALANQAWESQRFQAEKYTLGGVAVRAARKGNIDALGFLINQLSTGERNPFIDGDISVTLVLMTGQPLNAEKLQNWYSENRDKLVFDQKTKRYQIKK